MAIKRNQRASLSGGIPKVRVGDPQLQMALDALSEAVETLAGIRTESLDRAVTYRDLKNNNFNVEINPPIAPGTGDQRTDARQPLISVPTTVGRTAPPTDLEATADTSTHIVRLTWNHPDKNCEYVEIHRSTTDDVETAEVFAVSSVGFYEFCQSANNTTYYYWIRALSTNGLYSAFEPSTTAGVEAVT